MLWPGPAIAWDFSLRQHASPAIINLRTSFQLPPQRCLKCSLSCAVIGLKIALFWHKSNAASSDIDKSKSGGKLAGFLKNVHVAYCKQKVPQWQYQFYNGEKVQNITCLQVGEVLRVHIAWCEDMEDNWWVCSQWELPWSRVTKAKALRSLKRLLQWSNKSKSVIHDEVEGERWGSSAAGCGIHQPRLELALPNAFISNKFVMILDSGLYTMVD